MDPLSDVLSLLKPRSVMFRGLDAAAPWSLQYPPKEGIGCYMLVAGRCWLIVEGQSEAMRLAAGDCVLLARKRSFRLASDPRLPPCDAVALFGRAPEGAVVTVNEGGDDIGIGGYFDFAGAHAEVLCGLLPPVVHIRQESDKVALRASMELMLRELRDPQPGGSLVARHLAHLMLVMALRGHLAEGSKAGVGWLFALADPKMAAAIHAMHDDPAQPWTLQALARRVHMSRSAFAQRFKDTVGMSPMDYLIRWRMLLAGEKLVHSKESISTIALSLGYESDSAFSTAFKRTMGSSPRQYARGRSTSALASGVHLA